jgi:hypothetical protein
MADPHEHQRPLLDQAIEGSYLDVTEHASKIKTFQQTGRGNTILDLYEGFFYYMDLIHRRTSNQDEIINNAGGQSKKMREWLGRPAPKNDNEILQRCIEGVAVWEEYDLALVKYGLIVLPHRTR